MEFTARHAGTARFSMSRSSREALRPGLAPRERGQQPRSDADERERKALVRIQRILLISRICSSAGTPPRRTSPDDIL